MLRATALLLLLLLLLLHLLLLLTLLLRVALLLLLAGCHGWFGKRTGHDRRELEPRAERRHRGVRTQRAHATTRHLTPAERSTYMSWVAGAQIRRVLGPDPDPASGKASPRVLYSRSR
jgi:hypothetical protein